MGKIVVKKETAGKLDSFLSQIIGMRKMENNIVSREEVFHELIDRFGKLSERDFTSLEVSEEIAVKLKICLMNTNKDSKTIMGYDELINDLIKKWDEFDDMLSKELSKI